MTFRKLKAATTLITLLIVLFVGAMLIPASPVQAGSGCSSKKKAESDEKKGCDKGTGSEEKSCDKDKGSEEKKGCDKSEK